MIVDFYEHSHSPRIELGSEDGPEEHLLRVLLEVISNGGSITASPKNENIKSVHMNFYPPKKVRRL